MYEPLCLAFCFPFLPYRPWELRRAPKLLAYAREVHCMCKISEVDPRSVLRKLVRFTRQIRTMPEHAVRQMSHFRSEDQFPNQKDGIHLGK